MRPPLVPEVRKRVRNLRWPPYPSALPPPRVLGMRAPVPQLTIFALGLGGRGVGGRLSISDGGRAGCSHTVLHFMLRRRWRGSRSWHCGPRQSHFLASLLMAGTHGFGRRLFIGDHVPCGLTGTFPIMGRGGIDRDI